MNVKIPKGWRLLKPFEEIQKDDKCYINNRWSEVTVKGIHANDHIIIRFVGIGSGFFGTQKKYRSIDDI
jgi:hypothetical protein